MKRGAAVILLLAVSAALYWYWQSQRPRPEASMLPTSPPPAAATPGVTGVLETIPEPNVPTVSPPATAPGASVIATPASNSPMPAAAAVAPLPPELASIAPMTVLENMRRTIRQYGSMFGGNPVGTNPEITKALQGDNPKQIDFLKADGNRVNGNGELVDPWGTPYFFHQLSGTEMEIRSAGPDKRMWTADDLVVK
ncbi:MAG TPA: hypothetical protein VNZ64_00400 [Candidatus Acidoferrum sp.]|jgi:hypothetical protein|nr:hypothetical protein [Candidatus Acidoferrum sp.]